MYSVLADIVLVLHFAFVVFVVLGGLLVLRWPQVAWAHVPAAIWGVAIECGGWICPLTPIENRLRELAGESTYDGDFIARYLMPVLYPEGLTREAQVTLGLAALVLNLGIYVAVVRMARGGEQRSARHMNRLFVEAALAFLALPGVVAFLIPLVVIAPEAAPFHPSGLLFLAPGVVVLLWCVWEFYHAGKGTLAPWTPPKHLVVTGLYRFSRNPMYVGVILILWGWAVGYRSRGLVVYAFLMMIVFHLRVVLFEEPWLAQTHGDQWHAYRAHVRRWAGRR